MSDVSATSGLPIGRQDCTRARPRASDPVALPGPTVATMTDAVCEIALRPKAPLWWWIALIPSLLLTAVLVGAIAWLFYAGLGIWGIDWPVVWGFAIINYVWWIAIASGGTFISALFYLVHVEWRTSINRIAETMTLFAAACAGIYLSCISAARGSSTGCFPIPTPCCCGRSSAARCCGIFSRSWPTCCRRSCSGISD